MQDTFLRRLGAPDDVPSHVTDMFVAAAGAGVAELVAAGAAVAALVVAGAAVAEVGVAVPGVGADEELAVCSADERCLGVCLSCWGVSVAEEAVGC